MDPNTNISFPGQAISPNNPQSYQLESGGTFIIPTGNFLCRLGPQSAIQFKDYYSGLWRTFDTGAVPHQVPVVSDGTNYRVINLSGTISGTGTITAGTLYNQANATVAFLAPATATTPSTTATGTPIVGGSLTFTLAVAGTGYTNPIVVVPPPQLLGGTPGLCIPATATLPLTASTGVPTGVTAGFAGAGYLTAPGNTATNTNITVTPANFAANPNYWLQSGNIFIIDPAGSGAAITAVIANGTPASGGITGIIMTSNGAGYDGTHIPTVTFAGTTGSGASATALPWMALKSITVGGTNTGYTASVLLESTLSLAGAASALYDDQPIIRAARAIATEAGGVVNTPIVEDAGGGFQTVPLIKQVGNATADGSVNATFTAVVGGVTNNLILWQIG